MQKHVPPRVALLRLHRGTAYCLWATFISTLQWKPVTFCASLKCITHLDAVRSGKLIGRFLQTIALRFALPAIPNNQCTGTCRSSAGFSRLSRPGRSIAFLVNFESGGAGFCRGAHLPLIDQSGSEKKLPEILENSEFVWQGCGHGAVGGVSCDATNQKLSKKLLRQPPTAKPSVWTANSGRHGNVL